MDINYGIQEKPIDNYAYGSPYEILPVEASPTETNEIYEYTNCFH